MSSEPKDLVQIIKDNPGCTLILDNDSWQLTKGDPEPDGFDDWTYEAEVEWLDSQQLACDRDKFANGRHGQICYGRGVLEALADIVGIKVEDV